MQAGWSTPHEERLPHALEVSPLDKNGHSTPPLSSGKPSGWDTPEINTGLSDNADGWGQMDFETTALEAKGADSSEADPPETSPIPQEDGPSHRLTPMQLMDIASPNNAFRWHLADGSPRARLIGTRCRNLNMIAEVAGVVGICLSCKANERGYIYVIGSRSHQLDIEGRQSLYLAARIIGAVLALYGVAQAGPRPSDLKGVLASDQLASLLTTRDRKLIDEVRAAIGSRGQPYRTTDEDLMCLARSIKSEVLASQTQVRCIVCALLLKAFLV